MRIKMTLIAMTAVATLMGGCETEKQGAFGDNYTGRNYAGGGAIVARPGDGEPERGGGGRHGRRGR